MLLLDFMYIICCGFYKKREEDTFKGSGLILLSMIFMLNAITIYFILTDYTNVISVSHNELWSFIANISGIVLILPFLYIRYYRITNYNQIQVRIEIMTKQKKMTYWLAALIYILLSILLCLGYAFYKGGMKNGWW